MRCLALVLVLAGCGSGSPERAEPSVHRGHAVPERRATELRGEALGTTWMVKWIGPEDPRVEPAVTEALAEVDRRMSTWRDDSELSAVRAGKGPVVVSEETAEVVRAALALAEATGGAFDPTVQPLVELWGFHGKPREAAPTDDELQAALDQVGWQKVALGRDARGAPTIDAGGTALDLSAIAKGHAVDRVSHALSGLGLADHLVEVGGEVRATGSGPKGPWKLGVDRPEEGLAPGAKLEAVVSLTNAGMATSGNYRNTYQVDGQRVVHTLDPRTGRPAIGSVASATVVAPDCRTADGWATALMVLGAEAGLPLIEARPDVDALLLVTEGNGFAHRKTTGMEARLLSR